MDKKVLFEARKLIASFLKKRRQELGISVPELAYKCNVNKTTIYRIEEGKFMPNGDLLLKITHHLNCYFFLSEKEADNFESKWMRERWGKINEN